MYSIQSRRLDNDIFMYVHNEYLYKHFQTDFHLHLSGSELGSDYRPIIMIIVYALYGRIIIYCSQGEHDYT